MRHRRTIAGVCGRIRLPALAAAALILTGCSTYSDKVGQSIEMFRQGREENAIALYKDGQRGLDRQLNHVELGRFHLLAGQLADSRREFGTAIAGAIEREEGPVIRLRDVGGDLLSSTIVDDTMRTYQLQNSMAPKISPRLAAGAWANRSSLSATQCANQSRSGTTPTLFNGLTKTAPKKPCSV